MRTYVFRGGWQRHPYPSSVRAAPMLEPCAHGRADVRKCLVCFRTQRDGALRSLEGDVLVGCGVWEAGDQPEARLADARSDAVNEGELPDRRVDRPLAHNSLHFVQDRLTLSAVELDRLLLIELVEIGIASVSKDPALD